MEGCPTVVPIGVSISTNDVMCAIFSQVFILHETIGGDRYFEMLAGLYDNL